MNRQETRQILDQFKIRPVHALGQNFLCDDRVTNEILRLADLSREDLVLEIGPGLGALTREIARQAGKTIGIEIDSRLLAALQSQLTEDRPCRIIAGDAMQCDFASLVDRWPGRIKIVANLPYAITTPLMEKLLCELPQSALLLLMVQKEAAERIVVQPGSKQYSPLAILSACHGQVRREIHVPAASFFPQPRVDSCVIRINDMAKLQISNWLNFKTFLENCFRQRRKTLSNNLRAAGFRSEQLAILQKMLQDFHLPDDARPETLSPQQFAVLFDQIVA